MAQLVEHCSTKQKVAGSIPGQGTCLGCGPGALVGVHVTGTQLMFFSHTDVSLPLFKKIIKYIKKIFLWGFKYRFDPFNPRGKGRPKWKVRD